MPGPYLEVLPDSIRLPVPRAIHPRPAGRERKMTPCPRGASRGAMARVVTRSQGPDAG